MSTSEDVFIGLLGVEFKVHADGSIWRIAQRGRTGRRYPIAPRRADPPREDGYRHVRVEIDGVVYHAEAHRLVWRALRGPIPPGLEINHKNGRRSDNAPSNLETATKAENLKHSYRGAWSSAYAWGPQRSSRPDRGAGVGHSGQSGSGRDHPGPGARAWCYTANGSPDSARRALVGGRVPGRCRVSHLDTPSRGLLLAGINTDCPQCARHAASLRRLEALTRLRAHAALATGPTDPFARATHALEAAQTRYDEHLQADHAEEAAA